jgi:ATP-dependent RNA helicase DeaD
MGLSPAILEALARMGYTAPTDVQAEAIPLAMSGRDLMIQSRTGTGKTAAYAIPATMRLDTSLKKVQFLALTPTRELALQFAGDLAQINSCTGVLVTCIYGGASYSKQMRDLEAGALMVAGTPGRVLDHLRRRTLDLSALKVLVLDEADRMLDMGFYEEISSIIERCPKDRQTLLGSATFPASIVRMGQSYQRDPHKISLSDDSIYVKEVEHRYYITQQMEKDRDLYRLIEIERPTSSIIFCNTKDDVRMVFNTLRRRGLRVAMLTGDLAQERREKIMSNFRQKRVKHLVTTDVASRGIDVDDVSHVFLYSAPSTPEDYIHRAGRTGRMGKSGVAISFVSAMDLLNFNRLVNAHHLVVKEGRIPTDKDVEKSARQRLLDQIRVLEDKASAHDLETLEPLAKDLLEQNDAPSLVSLLLNLYLNPPEAEAFAAGAPVDQPAQQVPPEPKAEKPPGQDRRRSSSRPRGRRR